MCSSLSKTFTVKSLADWDCRRDAHKTIAIDAFAVAWKRREMYFVPRQQIDCLCFGSLVYRVEGRGSGLECYWIW